jgi:hypothetical protein
MTVQIHVQVKKISMPVSSLTLFQSYISRFGSHVSEWRSDSRNVIVFAVSASRKLWGRWTSIVNSRWESVTECLFLRFL